jgi:hypothetical protein
VTYTRRWTASPHSKVTILDVEHRTIVATFSRTSARDTDETPSNEEGVVVGAVGTAPWVLIAGLLMPFALFTQDAP